MSVNRRGRAGCGCLLFVVIIFIVVAGLLVHPLSLRVLTGLLVYQDKIVPSDALLVPRFLEDKNGEVYRDALREFQAGNGKVIYVEDDQVLGISVKEIVARMAKQRGVKEDIVKGLEISLEEKASVPKVRERLARAGVRRAILIVPEYASERFHMLYGSGGESDKILFLVKPVNVSYFKREKWWANEFSRAALQNELYGIGSHYFSRFKYGTSERQEKDKKG